MSDQAGIHDKTFSQVSDERMKAARQLGSLFEVFPDRAQAFEDLLKLCSDDEEDVREEAINSLKMVFPNVSEKELVWERFVNLTSYPVERILKASVDALIDVFSLMPDKNRAWKDLIDLINSKSSLEDVRRGIIRSLPDIISEFQDKEKAWNDLLEMTASDDPYVREKAAFFLRIVFPGLPAEKRSDAWEDLLELAGKAGDTLVREQAADTLVSLFPYLENNDTICKKLMKLTENENECIRRTAADTLSKVFPYVSDIVHRDIANFSGSTLFEEEKGEKKEMIGEREARGKDMIENEKVKEKGSKKPVDLLRLTGHRDEHTQKDSAKSFERSYSGLPDKEKIIEDLVRLCSDPDPQTRRSAIESLLSLDLRKSEKTKDIWREMLRLTGDTDTGVRKAATELLSHVFPAVEEKSAVFADLVKLTESQDAQLRKKAAELFSVAFAYSDDKQRAWDDLLRLTSAEDREVRKGAVLALLAGYPEVSDKSKVWSDLIRLSAHNESFVQRAATRALGPAFFYVPDKTLAWRDLQGLIDNSYIYVRKYALRSLGRASLWRALRAENEATYLFGLKEAVKYFKESAETSNSTVIPEFYYPFYEALLQILFAERSSRLESERYLIEVTSELGDLEENQRLLDILEEFAGLLRATGDLNSGDLPAQKKLLEECISAFDRASAFFESIEEDAILAQKTLKKEYQKTGKVVMEQKLKHILSGIKYKARKACLQAKGTPAEKITCTVSQKVRTWSFQDLEKDRKELDRQLEALLNVLGAQIPYIPENMHTLEKLEDIRQEHNLLERYRLVSRFIELIPGVRMSTRASGR